ncbi:MAG: pilus assembly protein N-terminal domain-containing protein [Flavobacteriaceae bacterium]
MPKKTAAAIVIAAALAAPLPALAGGYVVAVDRASIMRLDQPAATVIIGNPAIADASVYSREMLIITGKAYGTTNLIVLDERGEVISDNTVYVQAPSEGAVTVQRGTEKVSLACAPNCERVLAIGDSGESFSQLGEQIKSRNALATGEQQQAPN